MPPIVYLPIRLFLWTLGVMIPLFPTLQSAPTALSFSPAWVFTTVNSVGLFRDLFFVIVPASALALATTTDFVCSHVLSGRKRASATVGGVVFFLVLTNFMVLLSGFVGFLEIPAHSGPLTQDTFSLCSWIIGIGLLISLASEMGVSFLGNHHRTHYAHTAEMEQHHAELVNP